MAPESELVELSEAEIAFTLEIILRADSTAIPILKGKGAPKDCNIRDALVRVFAEHLSSKLRQHVRCFRPRSHELHSTSGDIRG